MNRLNLTGARFILLLLSSIIVSCRSEPRTETYQLSGDHIIKKTFTKNHVLICSESFLKEGSDTIEDGESIFYYVNGNIEKRVNFKDGKLHGPIIRYHNNGNIQGKFQCFQGSFVGETYWYDTSGNIMNLGFIFKPAVLPEIDDHGFVLYFDANGKVDSFNGHPIFCMSGEEQYRAGDTASLYLAIMPDPLNMKGDVIISNSSSNPRNTDTLQSDKIHKVIYFNSTVYKFPCKYGSTHVTFIYNLYSKKKRHLIFSDTLVQSIDVR